MRAVGALVTSLLLLACSAKSSPTSTYSVSDASVDSETDASLSCPDLGNVSPGATLDAALATVCNYVGYQVFEQTCGAYTEIEVWGIDVGSAFFYDASGALVGTAGLSANTQTAICTGGAPGFVLPTVDANGGFVCTDLHRICADAGTVTGDP